MQNEIINTFINIRDYYNVQKRAQTSLYKRRTAEATITLAVQRSKQSGFF